MAAKSFLVSPSRVPLGITGDACSSWRLRLFAHKWKHYTDERRRGWIETFMPNYIAYMRYQHQNHGLTFKKPE